MALVKLSVAKLSFHNLYVKAFQNIRAIHFLKNRKVI